MKISRMTTDQLAQALCDLAPPVCRIAADPAVTQALADFAEGAEDSRPLLATLSAMAEALLPAILRTHYGDLLEALAVLTGKDAQTLRAQSAIDTLRDARDCWDGELADFFASAGITGLTRSSL